MDTQVVCRQGSQETDITDTPTGSLVLHYMEGYLACGLPPSEFEEDLVPDSSPGTNRHRTGILHWIGDAWVAEDWSSVVVEPAWEEY